MKGRAVVGAAALGALACGKPAASPPATEAATRAPTAPPADSLIATAPGGAEIWFTLSRGDSGEGERCIARAVEIRHGGTRTPVPLLYTGWAPEIVNDTTIRARLADHCRPGDTYLVDLRTGRPTREHR
jgi:hypothetical protein